MTEPIDGWIWRRNLASFLRLLSRYIGYAFDDTDWRTVELGLEGTDDESSDSWYSYPLVGDTCTVEVCVANAVGGDEVSVAVLGAESSELRFRVDTLLAAYAES